MSGREQVLAPFRAKQEYLESRISAGIEANRKAWCKLQVTDASGQPCAGEKIKVRQLKSDFKLGANLFMLGEFDDAGRNAAYESLFSELFTLATVPFYWRDIEPKRGQTRYGADSERIYRRPAPDLCVEFCQRHGIEPKAHCLNYSCHIPDWLPASAEEERRLLTRRFAELSERYADVIPEWEVTNETFYKWKRFQARSPFFHEPGYVEWSFRTAERFFPGNKLFINEMQERIWDALSFYGDRSAYYMQIERALREGCRIDGIGMQFHMFHRREKELEMTQDYYDPERIYDVLDCYARFGKPLQITESTIPAYSYAAEDEAIQREILYNLYRIWFSHPAMEGVVYWNLVDGYAAAAHAGDMTAGENYYHGGLVRHDFTPKPAYEMLRQLFQEEWHTEMTVETDELGQATFQGFTGSYELTCGASKGQCLLRPRTVNNAKLKI